jgi:DNA-binding LacI/PurR family transcriptional regulator
MHEDGLHMQLARWKEIADIIRKDIERGVIQPGAKLPTETDMASHWNVSRMTAHRAMRSLQDEGLVERHPRIGSVVKNAAKPASRVIAILFHQRNDFLELQYLLGVRSGLTDQDHLLFWGTDNDPVREAQYLERAVEEADGVVLFPTCAPENTPLLRRLIEKGTPVVCLDRSPEGLEVDSVKTDNYHATFSALEFMKSRGHRRIAYFSEYLMTVSAVKDRYRAYRDAMCCNNDPEAEKYVRYLVPELGKYPDLLLRTVSDGLKVMLQLSDPPTAIFCMHDYYLDAVLESLGEMDIRVPGDIEIVSFNDCPMFLPRFTRSIHRIVQQAHTIGHIAVQRLNRRLSGENPPFESIFVPVFFHPASYESPSRVDVGG